MANSREMNKSGLSKAADRLVLNRIRDGIDWRVKKSVRSELGSSADSPDAVRQLVAAEVTRQLADAAERDFTLSILFGAKTRIKRTMSPKQYNRLAREIKEITGTSATVDMRITQEFRSLFESEARGLGRIAGGPLNILGKLVTPSLLDLPDGPVLEIGTLHGIFAPTLMRSLRRTGSFRHLTVVDPFTGHQMQGGKNIAVDPGLTPVVEEVARRNFRELGLGDDEVRIINGFSTDAQVQAEAGDRKYAVVVVDGDHFEDGVAKDLRWIENIMVPGGIAILDDYGDPKWPGVEAATTKYLADGAKMRLLGKVWTSGFLQMPKDA